MQHVRHDIVIATTKDVIFRTSQQGVQNAARHVVTLWADVKRGGTLAYERIRRRSPKQAYVV